MCYNHLEPNVSITGEQSFCTKTAYVSNNAYLGLLFQMSLKYFTTFYMSCLVIMREIQKAGASKMNVMYGCNNLTPIHNIKKDYYFGKICII